MGDGCPEPCHIRDLFSGCSLGCIRDLHHPCDGAGYCRKRGIFNKKLYGKIILSNERIRTYYCSCPGRYGYHVRVPFSCPCDGYQYSDNRDLIATPLPLNNARNYPPGDLACNRHGRYCRS